MSENNGNGNENKSKNKREAFSKFKESVLGTAAILGMITLCVGLCLAALNFLTAPIIEKRLSDDMEASITEFFGAGLEYEYIDSEFAAPVDRAVYVREASSKKLAGYCVKVIPQGFAGDIVMLVAVNTNITVRNVKILEMSETAGIGTKIESESWFAEQFKFKSRNIARSQPPKRPGDNTIDTISGATKSSKAFLEGVNAALEAAYQIKNQSASKITETEAGAETETETEGIFDE